MNTLLIDDESTRVSDRLLFYSLKPCRHFIALYELVLSKIIDYPIFLSWFCFNIGSFKYDFFGPCTNGK